MLMSTTIFLLFLFLTYAVFLLASRKSDARQARLQQRVAEALQESLRSSDEVVGISRRDSIGGSPAINRLLARLDFVEKLDKMIKQADVQITVSRLLAFCFIAGLMAGLAAYTLVNSLFAFLLALVGGAVPILHVALKR